MFRIGFFRTLALVLPLLAVSCGAKMEGVLVNFHCPTTDEIGAVLDQDSLDVVASEIPHTEVSNCLFSRTDLGEVLFAYLGDKVTLDRVSLPSEGEGNGEVPVMEWRGKGRLVLNQQRNWAIFRIDPDSAHRFYLRFLVSSSTEPLEVARRADELLILFGFE